MSLGANQIAAYAADLLDLEQQIDDLQNAKRDTYKALRDEHGKVDANALKTAVKLFRMDSDKRDEAASIDTEAQRMLAIIEKGRAPRATHAIANGVPVSAGSKSTTQNASISEAFDPETGEFVTTIPEPGSEGLGVPGREVTASSPALDTPVASARSGEAEQSASPADAINDACRAALKLRPHCLAALRNDLTKCGGYGKHTCSSCLKAHADAEGLAA